MMNATAREPGQTYRDIQADPAGLAPFRDCGRQKRDDLQHPVATAGEAPAKRTVNSSILMPGLVTSSR
jgi:hypothetical protein